MIESKPGWRQTQVGVLVLASVLFGIVHAAAAGMSGSMSRSLAFPLSLANGVTGNLVPPAGSSTKLSFESGKVAIGELPVPLPQRARRPGRAGDARPFFRPIDEGPHVRLLLNGVIDADGPVTNSGNQLMIDAVVSPSTAALNGPPFVIPFDIKDGAAFVDVVLPVHKLADGSVRVQILGVTVVDPEGQPFGVLGFQLPPARSTPVPRFTPTPGGTPEVQGRCFVGRADCTGPSYAASQEQCCRPAKLDGLAPEGASWCSAEQFDPSMGRCLTNACVACPTPPPPPDCASRQVCAGRCSTPCPDGRVETGVCRGDATCGCSASCDATPTPGACADAATCTGPCTVTCADGMAVAGTCVGDAAHACGCSAACRAPTPCGAGQCFDTLTFRCTGQACGPGLHCPLPNQLCDVSGRFCPCEPPPPPAHGRICCQCKEPVPACFDLQFVEAQPICPPGCETFVGQECDGRTDQCVPLTPCAADKDCDDQNGCTRDRCTADGCVHDCLCVGPHACGPGPGRAGHR